LTDETNVARACVVLELEADLVEFSAALRQRDPGEHAALWTRQIKRLWFKVFQLSGQEERGVPPMPDHLARELPASLSWRQAAIHIVASAMTAVSDRPDSVFSDGDRLQVEVERFLETPEGRERRAHIEENLPGRLE
jgi:hypothetical protein